MLLSDKKIKEIRAADKDTLREFINNSETIKGQALDAIEKKHRELSEKIHDLMDEKEATQRAPMSKAELLEYAKDELKKCRAEATSFLTKHLEDCQNGHASPFNELAIKSVFANNDKAFRLLWLFLLEKDIIPIIDGFNEIGMPAAERDAKIAGIDKKLGKLMAESSNIQ